ncbi:MAG TPA: DUF5668 domain-containing protein [Vicinamibacterales bacterium]|nr:DUF5668 domain-containing protein [Vicinamibacterales bacterium]
MIERRPSMLRITPQVIIGLLLIGAGLAITADNLGWIEADRLWRFWPVLFIVIGALKVVQTDNRSGQVFGVVLMFFGAANAFQGFDALWPLILVAIGALVVLRALQGPQTSRKIPGVDPIPMSPASPVSAAATGDQVISDFAFWSGVKRRITSASFKGGDLTAIMGGIEIDLRGAGTANGEAVIDVFALWGGIEITVPPDWEVSNRITPILGGAEDKSSGSQGARHRLVLRGFVVMGGVEVKT